MTSFFILGNGSELVIKLWGNLKAFKIFTLQPEEEQKWLPEKEAYKGIILGSSNFIEHIQDRFLQGKISQEIPLLKAVQKFYTVEEITARKVDNLCNLSKIQT